MSRLNWSDGGRTSPPSRWNGMSASAHEDKIRKATIAKYRSICEQHPSNPFAQSVLKQIRQRGFVSRKQAQALDRLNAR